MFLGSFRYFHKRAFEKVSKEAITNALWSPFPSNFLTFLLYLTEYRTYCFGRPSIHPFDDRILILLLILVHVV